MKSSARFFIAFCLMVFVTPLSAADSYAVTNTADSGPGSFREAILDAEAHEGPDIIVFKIPNADPRHNADKGVWTIRPTTSLPEIKQGGLEIDGGSQARFLGSDPNPYGPEIELDGSIIPYANGLDVRTDDVGIFELIINRFSNGTGIYMRNASNGRIAGCYIGVDHEGMKAEGNLNGIGLVSRCRNVIIVPSGEGKPNIISGNIGGGISLADTCRGNVIQSNLIGVNRTAADTLGNGHRHRYGGVFIADQSDSNEVSHNLIGGNTFAGVYISHSCGNRIEDNCIGTNDDFSLNFGNSDTGILIRSDSQNPENTTGNLIRLNSIGYSGNFGVAIVGEKTAGNSISENHISMNGSMGIWYNTLKIPEVPALSYASATWVAGNAPSGSVVEVFCDPGDQGRFFLGSTSADATDYFTLVLAAVPPFPNMTATATDAEGNTSQFSNPLVTCVETEKSTPAPMDFHLDQNHPNPFNPKTRIGFFVAKRATVRLSVFDASGREVRTLTDGILEAGNHFADFSAAGLTSGIYLIRLRTAGFQAVKKMVLLK